MKLLLENWRKLLKEESPFPTPTHSETDPEKKYFPIIDQLRAGPDQETVAHKVRRVYDFAFGPGSDRGDLDYINQGSFRAVFELTKEPDKILKIAMVPSMGEYKILKMNLEDIKFSKEFPLLFPKTYAYDPDGAWFIGEAVDVTALFDNSVLFAALQKTFPEELRTITEMLKDGQYREIYFKNVGDTRPTAFLKLISFTASYLSKNSSEHGDVIWDKASTQIYLDVVKPLALEFSKLGSQTFHELVRAMIKYSIAPAEVRAGNIGLNTDGKIVLIDSSVFDPDDVL
tara:strand:- start:782 stop:1639 length:858 start_codon:yes stop_codon:yes gene_type:complete